MLHLAVIGIVCAVSAPIEGTAFIDRNNESKVFCHFEGGEKTVISLPNAYDVVVNNSFDCAGQNVTNRTSSFFYDYIINQYRDSKNSSCSIMESVSSGKKERFRSKIGFPYRQKRCIHSKEGKVTPKTLRPPINENYEKKTKDLMALKKAKAKQTKLERIKCKSDLNCNEKKMLFRLKSIKRGKKKLCKGCKRHLDRLKVDDELDLNKRIEKLVKQIALENHRKEISEKDMISYGTQEKDIESSPFEMNSPRKPVSFPFFNHIKKIFRFSKNYFNNKFVDVNSVPVNSERGNLVSDKAAHISSYDLLKTMRKTTRFRRNPPTNHIPCRHNDNSVPVYKKELIDKSYPNSAYFKRKHNFLRRASRKFIPKRLRKRHRHTKRSKPSRHGRKIKNWPIFKKFSFRKPDFRLRRDDLPTTTENLKEESTTFKERIVEKSVDSLEKAKFAFHEESKNKEILSNQKDWGDSNSNTATTSEVVASSTVANHDEFNTTDDNIKKEFPVHTLEKPFLVNDFRDGYSEKSLDLKYDAMTELPLQSSMYFQTTSKYKYKLPNKEYLTPDRYLQIRHALRSYLIHNNVLAPVKRTVSPERKKRCGKSCSRSRKCWRSPPLLCIPYIKKGQEDQLRYLIRVLQSMIGKPFPPKVDIFERTKYKPEGKREKGDSCDYSQEDEYSEYTSTPSTTCDSSSTSPASTTCSQPVCNFSCAPSITSPLSTNTPPTPPISCPTSASPMGACPPMSHPLCPSAYPIAGPPACPIACPPPPPIACPPPPPIACPPPPPIACPPACPSSGSLGSPLSSPVGSPVGGPLAGQPSGSAVGPTASPAARPLVCPPLGPPICPPSSPPVCPTPYPPASPPAAPSPFPPCCPPLPSTAKPCGINPQQMCENFTPARQECPGTDSVPINLPFSFPILGQGAEQTTMCCNFEDFTTTPANQYSPTPFCHAPIIPTGSAGLVPPSAASERASQAKCPVSVRSPPPPPPASTGTCTSVHSTAPPRPPTPTVGSQCRAPTNPPPSQNQCSSEIHNSDIPIEQKEYFSFSAFSYNGGPDCGTESYQYSQAVSARPLHTQPAPFPLCNGNQKFYPQRTVCEGCFTTQRIAQSTNAQQRHQLTMNPTAISATQKYQPQIARQSKAFRKSPHPEYIFGSAYVKHDQRNWKPNKLLNKPQELLPPVYDDQFNPPTERSKHNSPVKYEISQNRLFRMHHRPIAKNNFHGAKPYDYDFYDKYPREDRKQNELSYSKYHPPRTNWNDYGEKTKEVEKRGKSTRRKREDDYYSWPERFESYNDYLDDPSYSDEVIKKRVMGESKVSEEVPAWTPPSYDMFSELAKAVNNFSTPTPSTWIKDSDTQGTEESTESSTSVEDSSNRQEYTTIQTSTNGVTNDQDVKNSTSDSNAISSTSVTHSSNHSFTHSNFTEAPGSSDLRRLPDDSDCDTAGNSKNKYDDTKKKKTIFFRSNCKTTEKLSISDSQSQTKASGTNGDKEEANLHLHSADDAQMPTTLKMASIAKGQKKLLTKPCPKVYTKVYPDSLGDESQTNETTVTPKVTTAATIEAKTTPMQSSTSTADLKLQILAVCEGYLEVIKLIKAQNQTSGEEIDMDLARYCESIISQNFNLQSDKAKKQDISESSPLSSESEKVDDSSSKLENDLFENEILDVTDDPLAERQLRKDVKKKNLKKKKHKYLNYLETNSTEFQPSDEIQKAGFKRKKKRRKAHSKRLQREEELLTKGVTQEQIELIKLLRKRKKALLSWLLSTKDREKVGDIKGMEYLDDEDMMEPEISEPQDSGTIKPKRDEKIPGTTPKKYSFVNESIFPVYAKQYGYDSGGEVREVEVLWRKVNEKTHEKKIFKNVSVLALLLTSTKVPELDRLETKLIGSNGYENEENSEILSKSENKVGFAADPLAKCEKTTSPPSTTTCLPPVPKSKSAVNCKTGTQKNSTKTTKFRRKNATHTVITKPDASTFVGKPPNLNKTHSNITRKISHRFGAAKDLFQEYSIEFLDYAVYILPIMFTILFLFCCLCCAVHIFHTRKKHRRKRKKRKIPISSDETTETTEESEFETIKRKRDSKRKRKSKDVGVVSLEKKRSKKFWNVLKLHPTKQSSDPNEDKNQSEKKKRFLRFLNVKKDEDKSGSFICLPLCEPDENPKHSQSSTEGKHHDSDEQSDSRGRKKEEEKHCKTQDCENEAAERRELIALLEELKKIETGHTEEKKEVKSVHVQYMSQEDDNSVFQRPEFSYPYEKNVFGLPKGYSFCSEQIPFPQTELAAARDFELYDGVNELTELLPCECSYYSKRNDYCDFRINHEGRCQRFLKFIRDSGVSRSKPFVDKNCKKNESENRRFIFNKYRTINTDESDGLMGVTQKTAGTEVKFMENKSPFTFRPQTNADFVEEMENFKRQLNNKKNVRLKDDGVLCRL